MVLFYYTIKKHLSPCTVKRPSVVIVVRQNMHSFVIIIRYGKLLLADKEWLVDISMIQFKIAVSLVR